MSMIHDDAHECDVYIQSILLLADTLLSNTIISTASGGGGGVAVTNTSTKIETCELLLTCIRKVRNKCTSDAVANKVLQHGIIYQLSRICKLISLRKLYTQTNSYECIDTLAEEELESVYHSIAESSCQLLANFAANGYRCKQSLWVLPVEATLSNVAATEKVEVLRNYLASAVSTANEKAFAAFVAAIYNSIVITSNDSDVPCSVCLDMFCSVHARSVLCQIFLSTVDVKMKLPHHCFDNSPMYEWLHILVLFLVQQGKVCEVYQTLSKTVKDSDSSSIIECLTHEQVVYLNLLNELFDDTSCHNKLIDAFHSSESATSGVERLLLTLATNVCSVEPSYVRGDVSFSDNIDVIGYTLMIQSVPLHLSLMASILCVFPRDSSAVRQSIASNTRILDYCLQLVHKKTYTPPLSTSSPDVNPHHALDNEGEDYKETVKLCLQLLGNIFYGCRYAQDTIRTSGGINLLLSRCTTDFKNPLAREWSLICVRNLTEGNEDNQRYIEELKLQNVFQDDVLQQQGINIEMDNVTGKIKVNQTKQEKG